MKSHLPVTVIMPVFNVEAIVRKALESLLRQEYTIEQVVVIDNHSPDRTVSVVRQFMRRHTNVSIRIIERDKTYGVSESYNFGANVARTKYIVMFHPDGLLPTKKELTKLMRPFSENPKVIAAGPQLLHRFTEWKTYNFWQKCLFASVVGTTISSGNGKFDAYNRKAYLQIGGYNTKQFAHTVGSEDADMYIRLRKVGVVVNSSAQVIHAHPKEHNYSLKDWIARRRFLAVSYGRFLQLHLSDMTHPPYGLLVKPLLILFTLLGFIYPVFLLPILAFPFVYMRVMFRSQHTNRNPRILVLPAIVIFLVFYETYYMLYSFLFLKARRV